MLLERKINKCKWTHTPKKIKKPTQIRSVGVTTIPHRRRALQLHFKALRQTVANDEHSDEEQRDSHPDSTLKRPHPIFCVEIKDENSCPAAANVRLSTHPYIHKCAHWQTHLSCKCGIITVLSARREAGMPFEDSDPQKIH